jgi:hypothetical protein
MVDLRKCAWNHASQQWYVSIASRQWRFQPFLHHDLLGSKVLGTSLKAQTYRKPLRLKDVPWLADHEISNRAQG